MGVSIQGGCGRCHRLRSDLIGNAKSGYICPKCCINGGSWQRQLLTFSTWSLVILTWPWLTNDHPWAHRKGGAFTLKDWAIGSTPENDQWSFAIWISSLCAIFLVFYVIL